VTKKLSQKIRCELSHFPTKVRKSGRLQTSLPEPLPFPNRSWAFSHYILPFNLMSVLKGSCGRPRRISTIRSEAFPSQSFGILPFLPFPLRILKLSFKIFSRSLPTKVFVPSVIVIGLSVFSLIVKREFLMRLFLPGFHRCPLLQASHLCKGTKKTCREEMVYDRKLL